MKYYKVELKCSLELASAFYEQEDSIAHEQIPLLEGKNEMPFGFKMVKIRETENGLIIDDDFTTLQTIWVDYLPNNFIWPMMSERLRKIIDESLTGEEYVDWISCKIRCKDETRTYYILRFNKELDVLDRKNTMFWESDGTDDDYDGPEIFVPVYSFSKIKNLSVFPEPTHYDFWRIPLVFYVNESVQKKIQKAKLTGISFKKVRVSE